jgi:23S rRNA A1618 N6-methylase RlmF
MHATEIDPRSVESARTNVGGNSQLREQIHVWQVSASDRKRQRVEWSESGDDADTNTVAMDAASSASPQPFDALFQAGPLRGSMQRIVEQMPDASLVLDFAMVNPPFYDLDEFSAIQEGTYHGRRRLALDLFSCGPHSLVPLLLLIQQLFGVPNVGSSS